METMDCNNSVYMGTLGTRRLVNGKLSLQISGQICLGWANSTFHYTGDASEGERHNWVKFARSCQPELQQWNGAAVSYIYFTYLCPRAHYCRP